MTHNCAFLLAFWSILLIKKYIIKLKDWFFIVSVLNIELATLYIYRIISDENKSNFYNNNNNCYNCKHKLSWIQLH